MNIRKVVVPVAGWGTRSLPATKNIPKEMLPIYNKPVVQYIVEEAIKSGLNDVVFVTNREKKVIEDHFDRNLQLEGLLQRAGKEELLRVVQEVASMANIISIRQKEQLGLGHAVLCAKDLINEDAFGVMLGDDLIFGMEPGLKQLIQVAASEHLPVVGVMEVEADKVDRYGIVAGEEISPGTYRVTDLVEKPAIQDAPSRLAIVGRYVLTPDIFPALEKTKAGAGGEIQLTDALRTVAKERGLLAVKMRGMRFDAGNWTEYLAANIYFALQDESIRDDLIKHLKPLLP
ncbi:UTP--glucose-1-phosphate uridylyltransferase GalU [Halodesulfovibrio sp. MK-HDV]|jgi:UTP--glucose-1-phosphate uridylyltransferase|uniref:UTP--glucose-1-phosphate uridylyltransferase GalU n=1 Tax=Halodesulfovibrio sp. MK-HDV TaxID=2599925 RepID=UPI00136A3D32|nr:UTP--glucose-1-phosphate uridylyltransferase GalU [Halodesulfovibrio sp. MK-HDV]KAF1075486.1 UTP--glucose-1-phosphate uridylyltransferase [Halodesulfovibrio sp. MK-HDV]